MRTKLLFALTSALALALAGECQAGFIVNGGFETPTLAPGAFVTIGPTGEPAGFGRTVVSGNVDVANGPVQPFVDFASYQGNNGLDLNGTVKGTITQQFSGTIAGHTYQLTFAYADNPNEGGISSADVTVRDVGSSATLLFTSITHSTSTNGTAALGDGVPDFTLFSGFFVATGTTTSLTFSSTSASDSPSGGILLDAVDVNEATAATPEPASMAMLCVGGGLMFVGRNLRQRRKTKAAV